MRGAGSRRRMAAVAVAVAAALAGCSAGSGSTGSGSPAATAASTTTTPPALPAATTQQLEAVVSQVTGLGVPGVLALVDVAGQGRWTTATGLADTAAQTPMATDQQFFIGSLTKTFTATATLQQVDAGTLQLDQAIGTWVPQLPGADQITVQQLLDHTSGLADYAGAPAFTGPLAQDPTQAWTPQQLLAIAATLPPAFAPGQGWKYSNTDYVALGVILQAVTGQDPADLIADITGQLGLADTALASSPTLPSPSVSGYQDVISAQGTDPQVTAVPATSPSIYWTAGGMVSTLEDLATWIPAFATGQLLSASSRQALLTAVPTGETFTALNGTPSSATFPVSYGLGNAQFSGMVGHDGAFPGYNSAAYYLPDERATFVVLLNAWVVQGGALQPVSDLVATSFAEIAVPSATGG